MNYFLLHKPRGMTPQQALDAYRSLHPEYGETKLGSAGRLDPMAEGLLVVMVGDENKNQSYYLGLDKTYEVELVLGVSTDSYDLLGLPTKAITKLSKIDESQIELFLATMKGEIMQPYPPYSAVQVKGRPLYWWARQDRLSEVTVPIAERTIYGLELLGINQVELDTFEKDLRLRISTINGDFRQDEIMDAWDTLLERSDLEHLWKLLLRVSCSSGTYVRGVVNQLGQDLGCGATTVNILRTKVGDWDLKDAQRLD